MKTTGNGRDPLSHVGYSRVCVRLACHESHEARASEVLSERQICFGCVAGFFEQKMPPLAQVGMLEEVARVFSRLPQEPMFRVGHYLLSCTSFVDSVVRGVLLLMTRRESLFNLLLQIDLLGEVEYVEAEAGSSAAPSAIRQAQTSRKGIHTTSRLSRSASSWRLMKLAGVAMGKSLFMISRELQQSCIKSSSHLTNRGASFSFCSKRCCCASQSSLYTHCSGLSSAMKTDQHEAARIIGAFSRVLESAEEAASRALVSASLANTVGALRLLKPTHAASPRFLQALLQCFAVPGVLPQISQDPKLQLQLGQVVQSIFASQETMPGVQELAIQLVERLFLALPKEQQKMYLDELCIVDWLLEVVRNGLSVAHLAMQSLQRHFFSSTCFQPSHFEAGECMHATSFFSIFLKTELVAFSTLLCIARRRQQLAWLPSAIICLLDGHKASRHLKKNRQSATSEALRIGSQKSGGW
ncbi:hypothetical protein Efla_000931 [Eimeria flavescens]